MSQPTANPYPRVVFTLGTDLSERFDDVDEGTGILVFKTVDAVKRAYPLRWENEGIVALGFVQRQRFEPKAPRISANKTAVAMRGTRV